MTESKHMAPEGVADTDHVGTPSQASNRLIDQ